MSENEKISWIFLSIAMASQKAPADYNGISMIADGINHAVPTHKELQSSITWLINKGFVVSSNKKYQLSDTGKLIYTRASENENSLMSIWKNVEKSLEKD
ncbi:MAG: hypothetical protein EOP53_20525 [Sphingobacteriales bacterium]|nr:MAG: hypothetical protein EOP53_20525 [Sphingobacteriales bacterium]